MDIYLELAQEIYPEVTETTKVEMVGKGWAFIHKGDNGLTSFSAREWPNGLVGDYSPHLDLLVVFESRPLVLTVANVPAETAPEPIDDSARADTLTPVMLAEHNWTRGTKAVLLAVNKDRRLAGQSQYASLADMPLSEALAAIDKRKPT